MTAWAMPALEMLVIFERISVSKAAGSKGRWAVAPCVEALATGDAAGGGAGAGGASEAAATGGAVDGCGRGGEDGCAPGAGVSALPPFFLALLCQA